MSAGTKRGRLARGTEPVTARLHVALPIDLLATQVCQGLHLATSDWHVIVSVIHDDPAGPEVQVQIVARRRGGMAIFDGEPVFRVFRDGRRVEAGELEAEALDHYRHKAGLLVEAMTSLRWGQVDALATRAAD